MKKFIIPLATAALFAFSCEKAPEEVAVTGVSINQTTAELIVGKTVQLSATITPSNATNQGIDWTTSQPSVATVSSNGLVTAIAEGKATIQAIAGGKSASCVVSVSKKTVAVSSISLNKTSLALAKGESITLLATVTPDDATNKNVSWTSSNSQVASVDSNGKVTAIGNGNATITAKADDKEATCEITVSVPVESISLNKTKLTLDKGQSETLIATVNPADATENTVTWTCSDLSVATVMSNGLVSAKGGGQATITARIGDKSASCALTVNVPVESVLLNQTSLTLDEGESFILTATVIPNDATDNTATWTSSDANIVSVTQDGTIRAIKQGSATIQAQAGDKQATCSVTVIKGVTSITLDKESLTVFVGSTSTLTATVLPDDATDKTITWDSSNPGVATVDNGIVKGIDVGETTITASSGAVYTSCTVHIIIDSATGVFAEYRSCNSEIFNGIVQAGSILEFELLNFSSETIHVVSAQLFDGQTGIGGDVTSLDTDISSESTFSWSASVSESDMYLPVARFTYIFENESYTCETQVRINYLF